MRVIADLISYLSGQGLLSSEDLEYLRRHGFLEGPSDEPVFHPGLAHGAAAPGVEDAEAIAERFDRRRPARRRGHASTPPALTAKEVSQCILEAWPVWETQLAPLVPLGRRLDAAVTNLEHAVRTIENAGLDSVVDALGQTLRRRPKQLGPLWSALGFSVDEEAVIPSDARGGAVQAYRAILAGRTYDELGRYRFALREPGLSRLLALVRTQRRLLRGFGELLLREPRLFDRGVCAAYPSFELCYWSLILAVSAWASTDEPPRPPWPLVLQLRHEPPMALTKRAWACAMAMEIPGIRNLLELVGGSYVPLAAQCPSDWSVLWFPR